MQYGFGSGVMWGVPLTDAAGTAIAQPSPVVLGALQEVALEFNFDTKMLHGPNQFPLDVARGKGKASGKAKFAQLNGFVVNSLFFGQTLSSGLVGMYPDTVGALIPTTPFTITVTPPNSGTYVGDLGVINSNGLPMTRVASAPATGQYSQAAAVYTFAAADTGQRVFINYRYSVSGAAAGQQMSVNNQIMGNMPSFRMEFVQVYKGKLATFILPKCVSTKLSFATKLDDYTIPDFDFEAFDDGTGNIATVSFSG